MSALPIQVNLIPGHYHVPPVVKLNQYEFGSTRQFEVYYGDCEMTGKITASSGSIDDVAARLQLVTHGTECMS